MEYQDSHLYLDFQGETARLDLKPLKLTPKEFELLAMLARNAGQVVPREALFMHIWGYGDGIRTRTLDVHVRRLRSKLDGCPHRYIDTIFGVGYRFERAPASDVKVEDAPMRAAASLWGGAPQALR